MQKYNIIHNFDIQRYITSKNYNKLHNYIINYIFHIMHNKIIIKNRKDDKEGKRIVYIVYNINLTKYSEYLMPSDNSEI